MSQFQLHVDFKAKNQLFCIKENNGVCTVSYGTFKGKIDHQNNEVDIDKIDDYYTVTSDSNGTKVSKKKTIKLKKIKLKNKDKLPLEDIQKQINSEVARSESQSEGPCRIKGYECESVFQF